MLLLLIDVLQKCRGFLFSFFMSVYFFLLILGFTGFFLLSFIFFNVRFIIAWMGIRLHTFISLLGLLGDSIQIQIYKTRQDKTTLYIPYLCEVQTRWHEPMWMTWYDSGISLIVDRFIIKIIARLGAEVVYINLTDNSIYVYGQWTKNNSLVYLSGTKEEVQQEWKKIIS